MMECQSVESRIVRDLYNFWKKSGADQQIGEFLGVGDKAIGWEKATYVRPIHMHRMAILRGDDVKWGLVKDMPTEPWASSASR